MDASLFVGRQRVIFQRMNIESVVEDQLADLPYIEWDASENETHQFSSTVTEHPVENGSVVSDHVIHRPISLTLRLLQTNHAIQQNAFYATGYVQRAGDGRVLSYGADRVSQAFEALDSLRRLAVPFEVVTSFRRYDNMLIESISVERNAKTGQALSVTVQLKQIRFVSNATVPDPRDQRAKGKKKEGLKPTTEATPAQKEASFSTLNDIGVGEALGVRHRE